MPKSKTRIAPTSRDVHVLAYDGLCAFEFGIAYEVFGLPRPEMGENWYRYHLTAVEPGLLRSASGFQVAAPCKLNALKQADLIIIPGWRNVATPVPAPLIKALQQAHARGAHIATLCSGVFVLAATGLLDGQQATTHWRYAAQLRSQYPRITVLPDVLYVDNGSLLTAAGSAAGLDLCLHIVRRDFGAEIANRVARRLVIPPHRHGGQAQFIEAPVPQGYESERLGSLIDTLRAELHLPHSLPAMAKQAGMSLRTFQRRFVQTTGESAGDWLIRERLHMARGLLEQDKAIPLEELATRTGFATAASLRHHFKSRYHTTPKDYRNRFNLQQ